MFKKIISLYLLVLMSQANSQDLILKYNNKSHLLKLSSTTPLTIEPVTGDIVIEIINGLDLGMFADSVMENESGVGLIEAILKEIPDEYTDLNREINNLRLENRELKSQIKQFENQISTNEKKISRNAVNSSVQFDSEISQKQDTLKEEIKSIEEKFILLKKNSTKNTSDISKVTLETLDQYNSIVVSLLKSKDLLKQIDAFSSQSTITIPQKEKLAENKKQILTMQAKLDEYKVKIVNLLNDQVLANQRAIKIKSAMTVFIGILIIIATTILLSAIILTALKSKVKVTQNSHDHLLNALRKRIADNEMMIKVLQKAFFFCVLFGVCSSSIILIQLISVDVIDLFEKSTITVAAVAVFTFSYAIFKWKRNIEDDLITRKHEEEKRIQELQKNQRIVMP